MSVLNYLKIQIKKGNLKNAANKYYHGNVKRIWN